MFQAVLSYSSFVQIIKSAIRSTLALVMLSCGAPLALAQLTAPPTGPGGDIIVDDFIEIRMWEKCTGRQVIPIEEFTVEFFVFCQNRFPGGFTGDPVAAAASFGSSANVGNSGSQSQVANAVASQQTESTKQRIEEIKGEDGKRFRLLDAVSFGIFGLSSDGESDRSIGRFESAYSADYSSDVVGVDFKIADTVVIGRMNSDTENDTVYVGGNGSLSSDSDASITYVSAVFLDNYSIDYYTGDADSTYANRRQIIFGSDAMGAPISDIATSNTTGNQSLHGYSINADWQLGDFTVGGFYSVDKIRTVINGYEEDNLADPNANLLRLVTPDQFIRSETSTFGARVSYALDLGWGFLIPNLEYASVHESKNDARSYNTVLAEFPTDPFIPVNTDAPDRDYLYSNIGLILAANFGLQAFVNIEQNYGHDFLDDELTTFGLLYEF